MGAVTGARSGRLWAVLGGIGVLLVAGGAAMYVAVGMGVRIRPPILVVVPAVLGLPLAALVWNRAAHHLAEMARGNSDNSGRKTARLAHRLGVVGSVIGVLIVAVMVLAIVVGVMVFGSDSSAPY